MQNIWKFHKGKCWAKKGNAGRNDANSNSNSNYFDKKQKSYIKQMIKLSQLSKNNNSVSDSESLTVEWKKGVNQVQQMYIAQ